MPRRPPKRSRPPLEEYLGQVGDLLAHPKVREMGRFLQHGRVDCLRHCLYVSYASWRLCRALGLDGRAAARGGLLHDFFLYDWHRGTPGGGLHAFTHPRTAAENAGRYFPLTDRERDVVLRHMWPLAARPPRYPESWVVAFVDKVFCLMEVLAPSGLGRLEGVLEAARDGGVLPFRASV